LGTGGCAACPQPINTQRTVIQTGGRNLYTNTQHSIIPDARIPDQDLSDRKKGSFLKFPLTNKIPPFSRNDGHHFWRGGGTRRHRRLIPSIKTRSLVIPDAPFSRSGHARPTGVIFPPIHAFCNSPLIKRFLPPVGQVLIEASGMTNPFLKKREGWNQAATPPDSLLPPARRVIPTAGRDLVTFSAIVIADAHFNRSGQVRP